MRLHRHSQRLRLFSILFLCLTVSILRGQTIFTGPANGDWFTAANWSAGLPAAGNNATILGGASVTINAPLTVNFAIENYGNITNSSIVIIANALTSSGAFANSGTMTIHAGVSFRVSGGFNNSGTVINKGIFNCNSVPFINTATGIVNNESDWQQFQAFINDGTFSNKAGVFTCPQVFTNNKTVENLSGATFKIDFGGSFTNSTGSSLTNGGNFQNLATFINNTTVTNTGVFTNNGIDDCNGVFNNENTGFFETTGTVNLAGTLNNKVGAKTQVANNFIILANGLVSNAGILQNNGALDVRLNGTLNSEAGSTINMGFGSTMTNAGSVGIKASALVISNGSIINNKNFDVAGTIDSRDGGQISNNDAFTLLRSG